MQETISHTKLSLEEHMGALEQHLQHVVDDPAFLLQGGLRSMTEPQGLLGVLSLRGVRRSIGSGLSWRRAGRLIRGGGVEDLTGSWSIAERHGMVSRGDAPPPHAICSNLSTHVHVLRESMLL